MIITAFPYGHNPPGPIEPFWVWIDPNSDENLVAARHVWELKRSAALQTVASGRQLCLMEQTHLVEHRQQRLFMDVSMAAFLFT